MKESIMGIHLFNVKSIDEYWLHLEKSLEFLLPCLQINMNTVPLICVQKEEYSKR